MLPQASTGAVFTVMANTRLRYHAAAFQDKMHSPLTVAADALAAYRPAIMKRLMLVVRLQINSDLHIRQQRNVQFCPQGSQVPDVRDVKRRNR